MTEMRVGWDANNLSIQRLEFGNAIAKRNDLCRAHECTFLIWGQKSIRTDFK